MKSIVVAMDKNRGIGAENDLLWLRDLPSDLKHFRALTVGKSVIMGRKTFESIGKPLKDRQNIVISRHGPTGVNGVITTLSLPSAYAMAQYDVCVIGGGDVYRQAIDDMDRLYVTEVQAQFPRATVFFPEIDASEWREMAREHHTADADNMYAYDFVTYERV